MSLIRRIVYADFDPDATASVAGHTYTHAELKRALDDHSEVTLAAHPAALAATGLYYRHWPSGERRPVGEMARFVRSHWDDDGELALLLQIQRQTKTPSWGVIEQLDRHMSGTHS